jgi:hypothetical protein
MLLPNRVMRNFTILILLLSGRDIIIDVTRLVVGAMLVALRCWLILIQIDGKPERGRKLRDFIVAIRSGFLARAIIGRRAPLVPVGLSDQSREFCNGIAFSAGSETFATHRSYLDSLSAPDAPTHARDKHEANCNYQSWWITILK